MIWSRARAAAATLAGDDLLRRLGRNISYLLSGNIIAAGLGLVTLALTARTLGPELLGVLALIEAYTRIVGRIVRLETWQALIRYGADILEQDGASEQENSSALASLMKFGAMIDVVGCLLAGAIAVSGAFLAANLMGWSQDTQLMIAVYAVTLVFQLTSTPTAILRLFDRFQVFAWQAVAIATFRFVGVVIAAFFDAGIWAFVLIFTGTQLVAPAILIVQARLELRRRGCGGILAASLKGVTARFQGIWGFMWSTSLSLIARKSTTELDLILVGALIDSTAAGLYHVAKRFGESFMKVGAPIQQVVYPDLAKLWARGDQAGFRLALLRISTLIGGACTLVLLVMWTQIDLILTLTVGTKFADSGTLVMLQMTAMTLFMCGIAFRPAMFSLHLQNRLLQIVVTMTVLFFIILLATLPWLGTLAPGVAHIIFNAGWLASVAFVLNRRLKKEDESTAAFPAGQLAENGGS